MKMREETEAVRRHYNADPKKEWDRLQKRHPYEKYITVRMMDRYIRPGDRILDIGGGPGHYSIHYANRRTSEPTDRQHGGGNDENPDRVGYTRLGEILPEAAGTL